MFASSVEDVLLSSAMRFSLALALEFIHGLLTPMRVLSAPLLLPQE